MFESAIPRFRFNLGLLGILFLFACVVAVPPIVQGCAHPAYHSDASTKDGGASVRTSAIDSIKLDKIADALILSPAPMPTLVRLDTRRIDRLDPRTGLYFIDDGVTSSFYASAVTRDTASPYASDMADPNCGGRTVDNLSNKASPYDVEACRPDLRHTRHYRQGQEAASWRYVGAAYDAG